MVLFCPCDCALFCLWCLFHAFLLGCSVLFRTRGALFCSLKSFSFAITLCLQTRHLEETNCSVSLACGGVYALAWLLPLVVLPLACLRNCG